MIQTVLQKIPAWLWLPVHLAWLGGAVGLVLYHGFDSPLMPLVWVAACQWSAVIGYVMIRLAQIGGSRPVWAQLRRRRFDGLALVFFATGYFAFSWSGTFLLNLITGYVVVAGGGRLFTTWVGGLYDLGGATARQPRPGELMLVSFTGMILLGGSLLSLPKALSPDRRHDAGYSTSQRVLDAFFTATSATCVTGLVVHDSENDLSRFGQLVVLGMIQLGGLGIMVFGSVFGLLLGRKLSLRESLVFQDMYSYQTVGQIGTLIRFIVMSTLCIEGVIAVGLYGIWPASMTSLAERWYYSVFHAVSAFCNAGFMLHADNLVPYRAAWQVYGLIMPGIVLGGLGFPVLADLARVFLEHVRRVWRRLFFLRHRLIADIDPRTSRLHLHSKLVLLASIVLISGGAVLLFIFESSGSHRALGGSETMRSLPMVQRGWAALFQSVTCRTAGFNVVPTGTDDLSSASLFLKCILMFIGGSPASTAGGVKTVTVAVLLLGLWATLRKREAVEVFRRRISEEVIRQAATILMVMFSLVSAMVMILCYTEEASLVDVLFECVSACGTVGLSTGLTPELTSIGKLVIMLGMLAGRLGPLTLLVALAGRHEAASYSYPAESVTIG